MLPETNTTGVSNTAQKLPALCPCCGRCPHCGQPTSIPIYPRYPVAPFYPTTPVSSWVFPFTYTTWI